jgi:hypothetical protein
MEAITEIQALQNAVNSCKVENMEIREKFFDDKRKSTKKYFITINRACISPVLDYEQMNHFILGFIKAKQLNSIINKTIN